MVEAKENNTVQAISHCFQYLLPHKERLLSQILLTQVKESNEFK
jgi:hypothetical protein